MIVTFSIPTKKEGRICVQLATKERERACSVVERIIFSLFIFIVWKQPRCSFIHGLFYSLGERSDVFYPVLTKRRTTTTTAAPIPPAVVHSLIVRTYLAIFYLYRWGPFFVVFFADRRCAVSRFSRQMCYFFRLDCVMIVCCVLFHW